MNIAIWSNMMNLEIMRLSDISEAEKDKYHMRSLICGILKKMIEINLLTTQKQIKNIENKLIVTKDESGGEG